MKAQLLFKRFVLDGSKNKNNAFIIRTINQRRQKLIHKLSRSSYKWRIFLPSLCTRLSLAKMLPTRRLPMHSVHRQCICNIDCCIPFSRQFLVDQISHLV
jgi:hypothetical protein